jgi:cytochrome c
MTNNSTTPLQPAAVLFIVGVILFLAYGCGGGTETRSVLVFSKTAGFRHGSIESGQDMFRDLASEMKFSVDFSEDAELFTQDQLAKYNVIVFLSTTGDILNPAQQRELERFMEAGGNWLGIHAAADTEYEWPWYNDLVGAYFQSHPRGTPEATILVDRHDHPATEHLSDTWVRHDEWYNYKSIKDDFTVLMRVDESTYEGGENGENHPIAWYKPISNGRMFYTGLGHTKESYSEPEFVEHVAGALEYLFGENKPVSYAGVKSTPEENRFVVEELVKGMTEPMELDLLPDGRPIWIERRGAIKVYDPDFEAVAEVHNMDVWTEHEDGMLGIALAPDFRENNWLYLYYSPNGEESVNRLSRFRFADNKLDEASEQIILDVPTDRNRCCHSGGSLEFGGDGLLYLSIGDNTNPFESDGFSPIDDSRDEPNFDARRSSANTMDLRGGIIRIRVQEDGSYTIPEGNLFPGGEGGRPEIYAMGMRNPFRISVDQRNGNVYWGDVGPDAGEDSTGMGPRGHDEVNVAREAGFFGWPLFIGDNKPYHRRDFAGGTTGEAFDPAAPVNDSRYNTGARELPPAQPAMIYYPYAESEEFPTLGNGGRNAMAGPVYYHGDYGDSEVKFPEYYDGTFFFYDWMRDYIMAATLDETGYVTEFEPFLPSQELFHPMDMLFGPDGSLYIIEYGRKWFSKNNDARLLRIRYNGGNRPPVPSMELVADIGAAPFTLRVDAEESLDYDGDPLTYTWTLNGEVVGEGPDLEHTIAERGSHNLELVVDDGQGHTVRQTQTILVGNSVPDVQVALDGNRSFFFPGRELNYEVQVSDTEDGKLNQGIDPRAVTVSIDYLEGEDLVQIERGHQVAGQNTAFAIGRELIAAADCAGCHMEQEASIGPSYQAVAERYRRDPQATDYLAGKIISGGAGVWGEQNMSAHPDLPEGDAKQMADYILSLAGPPPNAESRPAKGRIALDRHREGIPGRYYVQASYTDQGAEGNLPRLTTTDVVVLRSPKVPAHKYTDGQRVMAYHVEAKDNPLSDEDADVLVATNDSWVGYGAVDLTGIRAIRSTVMLVPNITSGGTIEVISGDPRNGQVIGQASVSQGISTYGLNELTIPVEATGVGEQPLFFRFAADSKSPEAVMGAIGEFEFLPRQPTK